MLEAVGICLDQSHNATFSLHLHIFLVHSGVTSPDGSVCVDKEAGGESRGVVQLNMDVNSDLNNCVSVMEKDLVKD